MNIGAQRRVASRQIQIQKIIWPPPGVEWIRLNTYGVVKGEGEGDCGGLIRDNNGA